MPGSLDPVLEPTSLQTSAPEGKATPKPKEVAPASEPPKVDNVVQFPSAPQTTGTDEAMRELGRLERERANYQPPKLQLPEKPKTINDDIQLWGALAIAFAGIASRKTRTPMTTALNAAAAALNGMRDGQKERADQAYKEWEQQTRLALETASYEQRAYSELMQNITRREDLALNVGRALDQQQYKQAELQFKTMTAALHDPEMAHVYDEGMRQGGPQAAIQAASGLYKQREDAARKLKESALPIVQGKLMNDAVEEMKASPEWQNGNADTRLKLIYDLEGRMGRGTGVRGAPFSTEQVYATAKAIVAGRQGPPTQAQLFGRYASPISLAVMDEVRELDPNYDPADWPTYMKAKALLQGKDGDTIRAFTVVTHHLAFLDKLKEELKARGVNDFGSQAANKIATSVAAQFGMPEVTNYQFAQQIVADEIVKAILGTSAGSMTERTAMGSELGKEKTPEQIEGIIGTAKTLASGQLTGQLSKYRHFIEKGWLSPDDVIPAKTLKQLGVNPVEKNKLIEHGMPQDGEMPQNIDIEGTELQIPNPSKVSTKSSLTTSEAQAKGFKQMRPLKNGGMAYSKTDSPDGPWVDADGNPLQ